VVSEKVALLFIYLLNAFSVFESWSCDIGGPQLGPINLLGSATDGSLYLWLRPSVRHCNDRCLLRCRRVRWSERWPRMICACATSSWSWLTWRWRAMMGHWSGRSLTSVVDVEMPSPAAAAAASTAAFSRRRSTPVAVVRPSLNTQPPPPRFTIPV